MQLNQLFDSFLTRPFNSSKCKTLLKLSTARIKLLRNKREVEIKHMRRELAQLLQNGQESTARIRVEHIIREQKIMAAYDFLELFCELVVVRLPIIESQRECPIDLREAVSSLIFAAPRCSDLTELREVQSLFAAKYGKEFVADATELRPDCGVNRQIIEKLSALVPSGDVKLKLMKEIAGEYNVEWDPSNTEAEFFKSPEDLLDGPKQFLHATQMALPTKDHDESCSLPVKLQDDSCQTPCIVHESKSSLPSSEPQSENLCDKKQFVPFVGPFNEKLAANPDCLNLPSDSNISSKRVDLGWNSPHTKSHGRTKSETSMEFQDVVEAAQATAVSPERAVQAAQVAADLSRSRMPGETHLNGNHDLEQVRSESKSEISPLIVSQPSFKDLQDLSQGPSEKSELHDDAKYMKQQVNEGSSERERERGSVFDTDEDDDRHGTSTVHEDLLKMSVKSGSGYASDFKFSTTSSTPTPPAHSDNPENHGNRESDQPCFDSPTFDETPGGFMEQYKPSAFDDESFFSYPNLF